MKLGELLQEKNEKRLLDLMAGMMIGISPIIHLIVVGGIKIPYGRHTSRSWGPLLNAKIAWFLQESPAIFLPLYLITTVETKASYVNWVLLMAYLLHYTNRALFYPMRIQAGKPTPIFIALLAFCFCAFNGYMQTMYLLRNARYDEDWIFQPTFIIGTVLFLYGMRTNIKCDGILRNLRKPGESGYKIPHGDMFEYVSCANFFGESVEWLGFALASWSLPAIAFAIFTAMMLSARSYTHHVWYLKKFEDYPKHRKVFIPFVI